MGESTPTPRACVALTLLVVNSLPPLRCVHSNTVDKKQLELHDAFGRIEAAENAMAELMQRVKRDFVSKVQVREMQKMYESSIQRLTARVDTLESTSTGPAAPRAQRLSAASDGRRDAPAAVDAAGSSRRPGRYSDIALGHSSRTAGGGGGGGGGMPARTGSGRGDWRQAVDRDAVPRHGRRAASGGRGGGGGGGGGSAREAMPRYERQAPPRRAGSFGGGGGGGSSASRSSSAGAGGGGGSGMPRAGGSRSAADGVDPASRAMLASLIGNVGLQDPGPRARAPQHLSGGSRR